jgi:hypothetical protein
MSTFIRFEIKPGKAPCLTAAGMKHVMVNGTFLIRDEQLDTEAFPGRSVRRPISE